MKKDLTHLLSMAAFTLAILGSTACNLGEMKTAPSWELPDLDGNLIKSSDYQGKVIILDFWATWCPPCRKEIPGFISLQNKYGKQGLVVIGVSLDQGGAKVVRPFQKQTGINYPLVLGNNKVVQDFGGIQGIPTTFIIDQQGNIVRKHVGYADEATFEKDIKPLLQPSETSKQ